MATFQPQRLASFQHERLRLNANSIRLVQIHGSSSKTAPLSLRISQYAKHKRPSYAAISYTWGSSTDLRPISINGKPFQVHTNLYNLLMHLRQRGESRFLWVDALCIDQANLAERNFHVQLMARIYDEAACALVWLGLPSDDRREARAVDFITEMAASITRTKRGGPAFADLYLAEKVSSRWVNLFGFCSGQDPAIDKLSDTGKYWSRTWIIQEFLQARQLEIVCGTAQLDWKLFDIVFTHIHDLYKRGGLRPDTVQDAVGRILASVPGRLTGMRLSGQAKPLQELLHEFYDAQCSEPRDKVYGLLGIAQDCGQDLETGVFRGPEPDYAKHILDVYLDVITYLRDTSITMSVSPLTILLLQRSLKISKLDALEYCRQHQQSEWQAKLVTSTFALRPSYISTIEDTIPGWIGIRDLRQSLETFDWSKYVGYSIEKRPSRTASPGNINRPSATSPPPTTPPLPHRNSASSTQQVVNALPNDLLTNALAVAEVNPSLATLYHYLPHTRGFHLPTSLLSAHHDDKASPQKPTLIIEHTTAATTTLPTDSPSPSPAAAHAEAPSNHLRLGFAPPGTRRGDLICQFAGTDLTLIARRPVYGGQGLQLVGRAIMVSHEGLKGRETLAHPACAVGLWVSGCLGAGGEAGEEEVLETDAISMFEILRGGEL